MLKSNSPIVFDSSLELPNSQDFIQKKLVFVKKEQERIADLFQKTKYWKKASDIRNCGNHIDFIQSKSLKLVQIKSNFRCHSRFCPYCMKAEANKLSAIMAKEIELNGNFFQGKEFIFVTLTVKNCGKEDLKKTVADLLSAKTKLFNNKNGKIGKVSLGSISKLEITINEKTYHDNRYHAHLHIMFAVDRSYFHDKDNYIDNQSLQEYWKKVMKLDYLPVVDIRKFKKSDFAELCKYVCKTTQIKSKDDLVALVEATSHRKLFSKTGCFKDFFEQAEKEANLEYAAREEKILNAPDYEIESFQYDFKKHLYVKVEEKDIQENYSLIIEILEKKKLLEAS